eukprot:s6935_g6.t2
MLIENESQLEEAARKVGFPSVLKPVGGLASLGVKKVNNEAELLSVYREVVSVMRGLVVSGGFFVRASAAPDERTNVDLDKVIDTTVMLEEYLDGDEVDIDIVMSNGEARYVTVSDNGPTHEPYFGETWGCLPSLLPREKVEDLRKMAEDSVKAIGFENGIFHVEGKYTSRGPRLIEVNARMGGGPIRKLHKHTFGVDLVVEQMCIAVGIPCNPCAADVPKKAVAYAYCHAPRGGCIPDRQMFEAFKQREGILWVAPLIKPGDRVFGPEEGMPQWIAEILVESDDGNQHVVLLHVSLFTSCKQREQRCISCLASRLLPFDISDDRQHWTRCSRWLRCTCRRCPGEPVRSNQCASPLMMEASADQ